MRGLNRNLLAYKAVMPRWLIALLVTRLINFVQHSGKLIFAIANTFMQPWPEVL